MISEHELVPAIRGWLSATSDLEIPTGLSREEAGRRGHDLLVAISSDSLAPDHLELDEDSNDVLWAAVEELDVRPIGHQTLEECDRFYQFVLALSISSDPFNERDDILHRVARIGWRSGPGGLEAVLKARSGIWEHGGEGRYRDICETADQLPARVSLLQQERAPNIVELKDVYARLAKLVSISPGFAAPLVAGLETARTAHYACGGLLDEREHLKACAYLIAGIAARQLGQWDKAEADYGRASLIFQRTAEIADLERVEVERLSLAHLRKDDCTVVRSAPELIERIVTPRERVKARLLLASALHSLNRPQDALPVLEAANRDPAIEEEPAFQAWLLTKSGNTLSDLGRVAEAMAKFRAAGLVLAKFQNPMQLADLAAAIGEHLTKVGSLEQATILYKRARDVSTRLGQSQQVGYLSVLLAELLMVLGRPDEAESELLAALPLIEKFNLRKEAFVAVALLREAMAKRRTDVKMIQSLRDQLLRELN